MKSLRSTGSSVALARGLQVGDRAAEERRVGEHRQRRRAAALVGLGRHRRIEVGREVALRRRRRLISRDHRDVPVGAAQRAREVARSAARRARVRRSRSRVCGWCSTVTSSRFVREDLVEDAHSSSSVRV